jgi:uncharacterized protein (TIGR02453 family)
MKNALNFLKNLKNNNNKAWFEEQKTAFLEAKQDFENLVNSLISELRKFDKDLGSDLSAKECTFRIYKDVRFSKDKNPYKTNFGASIQPGGKKSGIAGYYLHLEPGNCFLAGGNYMPSPEKLQAIRQEIDYNGKELKKILGERKFINVFKELEEIDVLKTTPKGFEKDHPYLPLLKHKHFIASATFQDKVALSGDFIKLLAEYGKTVYPFLQFLRKATS